MSHELTHRRGTDMVRFIYVSTLVLLLGATLQAAPPTIQAPEQIYTQVGEWAFLTVTTDGKGVKCIVPKGVSQFPSGKLKDPNEMGFRATKVDTYTIVLYTGNADGPSEPKYITLVVGHAPIPPTPGPIVPDPKTPDTPVVPEPKVNPLADPALVKLFQKALDDDTRMYGVGQAQWATKLGNVYLETSKLLDQDTTNTLTFGNLYNITFTASTNQKIPRRDQALTAVRKVIDEMGKHDASLILRGEDKRKYVDLWNKIGASLVEASK